MPNRGADLPKDERTPRAMRGRADDGRDIFCLVKQNMSDSSLCQLPLLVWPSTMMNKTNDFFRRMNDPGLSLTAHFNDERAEELKLLRTAISKDFPHMTRALRYYDDALNHRLPNDPFTNITFCDHAAANPGRWHQVNLGDRAPPPKPHALQVVFHRARV